MSERLELLMAWAPFLMGGFGVNILVAVVATIIGTAVGAVFAVMGLSKSRPLVGLSDVTSSFFRNVPTLVLVFYLAMLIPNEILFSEGRAIQVPLWVKASIALSASPLGFTSWNLRRSILMWTSGKRSAALMFVPNWLSGFLITLMASSASSLVGVSDLVGRSNTVIAATGSSNSMLIYLFAALIFIIFGVAFSWVVNRTAASLVIRYS